MAPVAFFWQCVYNDIAYNVIHILISPEATIQMNPANHTTVHVFYRSALWTEFVLYLHNHANPPPPQTANRWAKKRYFNICNHLIQLYKAPRKILRAAMTQADRVITVSASPVNGRHG